MRTFSSLTSTSERSEFTSLWRNNTLRACSRHFQGLREGVGIESKVGLNNQKAVYMFKGILGLEAGHLKDTYQEQLM